MTDEEDVFYYIMAMNERYLHPPMPEGVEKDIIKGMYLFSKPEAKAQIQLLGSGAILNEVIAAAELLKNDFNIAASVFSVTSFSELRREAASIMRKNMLNPAEKMDKSHLSMLLAQDLPIVAATDYVRAYADLIRPYLMQPYITLGTDGFGRSDTRERLRRFFEVDRYYIVVAALYALVNAGKLDAKTIQTAIKKYGIDPKKADPVTV